MKRTVLVLFLAAPMVVLGPGSASSQDVPQATGKPRQATLSSLGLSIRGKLGSSCLPSGTNAVVCADAAFDPRPTRGRLPVRGGRTLRIRTGAPARSVGLHYFDSSTGGSRESAPDGRARRRGGSRRDWIVRLPKDLGRTDVVYVFVRYAFGDASFGARVRTGACR